MRIPLNFIYEFIVVYVGILRFQSIHLRMIFGRLFGHFWLTHLEVCHFFVKPIIVLQARFNFITFVIKFLIIYRLSILFVILIKWDIRFAAGSFHHD